MANNPVDLFVCNTRRDCTRNPGEPIDNAEDPTVQMVLEDGKVGVCGGDCSGNRIVAIHELVSGVNIALGLLTLDDCPALDAGVRRLFSFD